MITRESKFQTSVYRKPTFTGLGSSFFSFCPMKFKTTSIQTLIVRAFRICSTYISLHMEFNFLRNFFSNNGYPRSMIDKLIKKFLDTRYSRRNTLTEDASIHDFYVSSPYFCHQSEKMKRN